MVLPRKITILGGIFSLAFFSNILLVQVFRDKLSRFRYVLEEENGSHGESSSRVKSTVNVKKNLNENFSVSAYRTFQRGSPAKRIKSNNSNLYGMGQKIGVIDEGGAAPIKSPHIRHGSNFMKGVPNRSMKIKSQKRMDLMKPPVEKMTVSRNRSIGDPKKGKDLSSRRRLSQSIRKRARNPRNSSSKHRHKHHSVKKGGNKSRKKRHGRDKKLKKGRHSFKGKRNRRPGRVSKAGLKERLGENRNERSLRLRNGHGAPSRRRNKSPGRPWRRRRRHRGEGRRNARMQANRKRTHLRRRSPRGHGRVTPGGRNAGLQPFFFMPKFCNCKLQENQETDCYFYTESDTNECRRHDCSPEHTCVDGRSTGITCALKEITQKIVSTGRDTCETQKVYDFSYVPFTSS